LRSPFFYLTDMKLEITTQPTGTDILPLSTAKEFLRVDHSDEDTTITALINAAVQHCQDYTNRHFVSSNFTLSLDDFYNCEFSTGPINTITGVTYKDVGNATQTLATSKYWYDTKREPGRIHFENAPDTYDDDFNVVTISGTLGAAPATPVVHAIKMLVAHYYENRRAVITGTITAEIPLGVAALLNPYRIITTK
jgi:uncharacterized phiE125 gp8 family phage protein